VLQLEGSVSAKCRVLIYKEEWHFLILITSSFSHACANLNTRTCRIHGYKWLDVCSSWMLRSVYC